MDATTLLLRALMVIALAFMLYTAARWMRSRDP